MTLRALAMTTGCLKTQQRVVPDASVTVPTSRHNWSSSQSSAHHLLQSTQMLATTQNNNDQATTTTTTRNHPEQHRNPQLRAANSIAGAHLSGNYCFLCLQPKPKSRFFFVVFTCNFVRNWLPSFFLILNLL